MTEFFSHPLVAIVLFIGILIFIHELGHFLVGKFFGIGVETFSIGFGPNLFSFKHKGTEYCIACLPLGGYVKFAGVLPSEDVPKRFKGMEMYRASRLARSLTILAGPLANLFLAAVIYACFAFQGIEHTPARIGQVLKNSPAEKAGLQAGDGVLSIEGTSLSTWESLRKIIAKNPSKTLNFTVKRNDAVLDLKVTPELSETQDAFSISSKKNAKVGISPAFIPAVLTVSPGSYSEKIGLHSGMRVKKISFSSQEGTESLVDLEILSWQDFLKGLSRAYEQKAFLLNLDLEQTKKSKTDKGKEARKTLKFKQAIDLAEFSQKELRGQVDSSFSELKKGEKLAQLLGLHDSQLTLDEITKPSDSVLQKGDVLIALGGQRLSDYFSLYEILRNNKEEILPAQLMRQGNKISLDIRLKKQEVQKMSGVDYIYLLSATFLGGPELYPPFIEKYDSVFSAFMFGLEETWRYSLAIVSALKGLITGQVPLQALGGPILIAKVASDAASQGFKALLSTLAIISINLGVFNLFPIPVLDGGQLFLVLVETIRRRPLSVLAIENFQRIGFVMIMSLVVLATYNDLSRFWASIVKDLSLWFK